MKRINLSMGTGCMIVVMSRSWPLSRREKEASRTSSRSHLGHSSDPGGYLPMSGSAVYAFLQQDCR